MNDETNLTTIDSDGPSGGFMSVSTFDQAVKVSEMISKSQFCPKQFYGKPGDIMICIQMGQEVGLKPMQALQNIAVINGRPSVWGDAMMAICRRSPDFEYIDEQLDSTTMTAVCKVKRKNEPEVVREFSKKDAESAGLWKKGGAWTLYPGRMLQMRARGFALRDAFTDALRGIISREEAMDIKPEHVSRPSPTSTPAIEPIDSEQIAEMVVLAERAEVSLEDICKVANVDDVHKITSASYNQLRSRLMKKARDIEQKEKLKMLTEGSGVPDIIVEAVKVTDE